MAVIRGRGWKYREGWERGESRERERRARFGYLSRGA